MDEANAKEKIERILKDRRGRKGATGHATTCYNIEDKGDPNIGFDPAVEGKGERQV